MLFIIFLLGLAIGSFLNVVIYRLKAKKNFIFGRSFCPQCRHSLYWYDNIPLISFLSLKGKCRYCKKKISWQYPLVEFSTAVLFCLVYLRLYHDFSLFRFSAYLFFVAVLMIIFVYDLNWYLILDKVTLPAIILCFIINRYLGYHFLNLLMASFLVGVFFFLQFFISRGKWIGGGDIRLGLLMGAMLGFPNALVALIIAYFSGSIVGIFLIFLKKKKMSSRIPFGTFLAFGSFIALLYGGQILRWYMGIIR